MRPWVIIVLVALAVLLWLFGAGLQLGSEGKPSTLDAKQIAKDWFGAVEELIPDPDPLTAEDVELADSCGAFPELQMAAGSQCAVTVREGKPRRGATITKLAGAVTIVFQPPRRPKGKPSELADDPADVAFGKDGGQMILTCISGPVCRVRLVK